MGHLSEHLWLDPARHPQEMVNRTSGIGGGSWRFSHQLPPLADLAGCSVDISSRQLALCSQRKVVQATLYPLPGKCLLKRPGGGRQAPAASAMVRHHLCLPGLPPQSTKTMSAKN